MAELVDGLQGLGYVERRRDPERRPGEAGLPDRLGMGGDQSRAPGDCRDRSVTGGRAMGAEEFARLCDGLQALLDELDPGVREGYRAPR